MGGGGPRPPPRLGSLVSPLLAFACGGSANTTSHGGPLRRVLLKTARNADRCVWQSHTPRCPSFETRSSEDLCVGGGGGGGWNRAVKLYPAKKCHKTCVRRLQSFRRGPPMSGYHGANLSEILGLSSVYYALKKAHFLIYVYIYIHLRVLTGSSSNWTAINLANTSHKTNTLSQRKWFVSPSVGRK